MPLGTSMDDEPSKLVLDWPPVPEEIFFGEGFDGIARRQASVGEKADSIGMVQGKTFQELFQFDPFDFKHSFDVPVLVAEPWQGNFAAKSFLKTLDGLD